MTKSLSSMVSSASGKKCRKPCQSSSSASSCCTEQCIDCCSSQYQRLSLMRNMVLRNQLNDSWGDLETSGVSNRCGTSVPYPNVYTDNEGGADNGAYSNETGCTSGDSANVPVSFVDNTGEINDGYQIPALGYYFVNQLAYGPYEPGCHNDQVNGWYVNLETGELQLFNNTEGVPTNATRACLSANVAPTSTQKKQLKVLNKLYKLSKSAVKEINGIPATEGNIVEVCDCKGGRWLLYVNTVAPQDGSPLSECNYEFTVVATKLC